jgi:23S rRNA (uracil1939-C5)-methyltransferase
VLVRPTEEARQPIAPEIDVLIGALAALPDVAGVARQQVGGTLQAITGSLFGSTTVGDATFSVSAGSFFQANVRLLPELIERLRQEVAFGAETLELRDAETQRTQKRAELSKGPPRVADVYGGVGVFGISLAGQAKHVTIVESDGRALEAGRRTAARLGLSNVEFIHSRAEDVVQEIGDHDVVILDPPRSGLANELVEALVGARVETILYISCLAQSLARDLRLLQQTYRVAKLELFDFYPQTYHVELLAVLRRLE